MANEESEEVSSWVTTLKKHTLTVKSVWVTVSRLLARGFHGDAPHWMNKVVTIDGFMPQSSKFLSKDFRRREKKKNIIYHSLLSFAEYKRLSRRVDILRKKEKKEASEDITYIPQRNQLLFQSGSQKTWIYFIFSFLTCKKILKSAYIDWTWIYCQWLL